MKDEHAVAGLMPYIKYYLPQAQVVPLVISGRLNEDELRTLANKLAPLVSSDTILITAVDFSHYLPSKTAWEKDEVTEKVMREYDYQKLFKLNNDYLDSPPSIAVMLMTMENLGKQDFVIINHTNSGELLNDKLIPTTSYFSLVFYE